MRPTTFSSDHLKNYSFLPRNCLFETFISRDVNLLQVNAVNCNTSWKVTLFMKFSDYREDVLKGVCCVFLPLTACCSAALGVHVFRAGRG